MRCSRPGASWARTSITVASRDAAGCDGHPGRRGRRRPGGADRRRPARRGGPAMSREPSRARTRSARSRAACGQGAVLGGDPPVQQQHGALDAVGQVQGAQLGGADGQAVHGEDTGHRGQHARLVRYGDEELHAERLGVAGRLLPRSGGSVCARSASTGPPVAARLDREPLLLGGGRGRLGLVRGRPRRGPRATRLTRSATSEPRQDDQAAGPVASASASVSACSSSSVPWRADRLGDRAHGGRVLQVAPGGGVDEQQVMPYEGGEDGHVVRGRSRSGRPRPWR